MPFGTFTLPDDFTQRLKQAQFNTDLLMPSKDPATSQPSPNQQFDIQNAARQGQLIAPRQDVLYSGINEREQQANQASQIATDKAYNELAGRRKSYYDSMQSQFSNPDWMNGAPDLNGGGWDSEMMNNAQTIYNVGKQMGIDDRGIQIGIMTALTESGLKNVNYGDRDSLGLFQQRPSQGWGTPQQVLNPNYAAQKFFSNYQNGAGGNPWMVAQNIQRSAFADGSNYAKYWGQAQNIFGQLVSGNGRMNYAGGSVNPIQNQGLSSWINANNNRYLDYDNAYGAQCVDLYAFYTRDFVGGSPNPVGYAPEIYNNYDSRVYNRLPANVAGRVGDVAVWGRGPYTPLGHVAVVVGDNGNGTLRVLQSNATSLGSRGPSIISNISKAALMGYLRPYKLG